MNKHGKGKEQSIPTETIAQIADVFTGMAIAQGLQQLAKTLKENNQQISAIHISFDVEERND
jgi:hypothetical protein